MNPNQATAIAKIKARETTGSVVLMRINTGALKAKSLTMPLGANNQTQFDLNSTEAIGPELQTWTGSIPDVPGQATLIINGDNITGTVQQNSDLYRIEPVGNGVHALIKLDPSRFPPDHPPSFEKKERDSAPQPSKQNSSDTQPSSGITTVDVLVAYTTKASAAVPDIRATVALAVAEANQSYANSRINMRLNLVDTMPLTYDESGKTYETIVSDLATNTAVRQRRDELNADIVAMLVDQPQYCGMADAIMATADTAFAAVYFDCAVGYYSFAHELGHLMGARHDPANDPTATPFSFGHGYQHMSGSNWWRTIMAYACPGQNCARLQYWSSPNVSYNGTAMGTPQLNDNARVLNTTAPTVAAFRTAKLVSCNVFGDSYTNSSGPTDAIYFRSDASLCMPDGTAAGICRKWFGQCSVKSSGEKVNFSVFEDNYTNQTAASDAVYFKGMQAACVPDGTASGNCRRWVGRPKTASGKPVQCYLFNDNYTSLIGPTDAIYVRGSNEVCMPDGTATGQCRRWFGRCKVL